MDSAKPLLTGEIYDRRAFAGTDTAGTIDLGHYQTSREENYQMAIKAVELPKTKGQTYYEEVEALKKSGTSNADAIREVAKKHGANENAIRGGIHQYRSRHVSASSGPTATVRRLRQKVESVDDLVASARQALEAALNLIDKEVDEAKTALGAAQKRYDEVQASVNERKADIQKKLEALS